MKRDDVQLGMKVRVSDELLSPQALTAQCNFLFNDKYIKARMSCTEGVLTNPTHSAPDTAVFVRHACENGHVNAIYHVSELAPA